MRYMLFAGDDYYPCGGMEDFRGRFETMAELVLNVGRADWFNVYDLHRNESVPCPDIRWMNAESIRIWAEGIDAEG